MENCGSVGGGIRELKIDYAPGYRVYFAEVERVIVVLLGGGFKDSQRNDIARAKKLWEVFSNDTERFQRDLRP